MVMAETNELPCYTSRVLKQNMTHQTTWLYFQFSAPSKMDMHDGFIQIPLNVIKG